LAEDARLGNDAMTRSEDQPAAGLRSAPTSIRIVDAGRSRS